MTDAPEQRDDDVLRIPLIEEVAHIGVKEITTGRVRVTMATDTEETTVERDLYQGRVQVERVPVDRWIGEGEAVPTVTTRGNVTVVPVLEEVLVVERRLRLKEEVRITHHASTEQSTIPVRLRRQRAVIERAGPDGVFVPEDPAPTPDHEE